MYELSKPLYALTVGEFIELNRQIISEIVSIPVAAETNDTENNDMLTIKELSKFLHCSTVTVYNHRKKGLLPAPFHLGRKLVWKKSELMDFLKKPINKRRVK